MNFKNIILIFCFFSCSIFLKSENIKKEYSLFAENNIPESRLLINKKDKKIKETNKKKHNIPNQELKKIKEDKEITSNKKYNTKKINKPNHFTIKFLPEDDKLDANEIKAFTNNLANFSLESNITIKGYAEKRENDSTSKVRRLSLKRALFLRSLMLKNNFKISNIYVKALGYDNKIVGNKDIAVISIN